MEDIKPQYRYIHVCIQCLMCLICMYIVYTHPLYTRYFCVAKNLELFDI